MSKTIISPVKPRSGEFEVEYRIVDEGTIRVSALSVEDACKVVESMDPERVMEQGDSQSLYLEVCAAKRVKT